jgi:hypothetical protein
MLFFFLCSSFKNVEMVVSKSYHGSGVITILIMFEVQDLLRFFFFCSSFANFLPFSFSSLLQFTVYVCISETKDENPLLDSRFPDVSGKGRGYQIEAYNGGTEQWPDLRKISVWQTVSALEQEFREKAAQFAAQSKSTPGQTNFTAELDEQEKEDDELPSSTSTLLKADEKRSSTPGEEKGAVVVVAQEKAAIPVSATTAVINSNTAVAAGNESKTFKQEIEPAVTTTTSSSAPSFNKDTILDFKSESKNPLDDSTMKIRQALPHHIPKMDGLGAKLGEIRKNLGDGVRETK